MQSSEADRDNIRVVDSLYIRIDNVDAQLWQSSSIRVQVANIASLNWKERVEDTTNSTDFILKDLDELKYVFRSDISKPKDSDQRCGQNKGIVEVVNERERRQSSACKPYAIWEKKRVRVIWEG